MKSLTSANHTVLIIGPVEEEGGRSLLQRLRWRWQRMKDFAGAALLLRDRTPRIVICEQHLPDGSWKDVVDMANGLPCAPPVIVTSRLADERLWIEVLNRGGYDLLAKPLDGAEVRRVTDSAWQDAANRRGAAGRVKARTHIKEVAYVR